MRNSSFRTVKKSGGRTCFVAAAIAVAALSVASCSFGPARVKQPGIDASAAGDQAMELYDTDGNGVVSGAELEKALGLKAALARLDTNGDKGVSADEVVERVKAWQGMRTGMAAVRIHVTMDGAPLVGGKVTLEPEPFLGDEIKAAYGTTNALGDVAPTIPPEDRPDPTLPGGVHFGLYRVRISKDDGGRERLPARYNSQTTLGQEISYDEPTMAANSMAFVLKSK